MHLEFPQISEGWETPADDWVLHTWSRGVLGGRVVPVGCVLENGREFLAVAGPGTAW